MAVNIGEWLNLGTGTNVKKEIGLVPEYNTGTGGGLFVILSVVLRNIYVIAAIILFIMIFIGGLGMIINAGNAEKQKQSNKTLGSAVLGFVIMFLSYWLIKIIGIITGTTIIL